MANKKSSLGLAVRPVVLNLFVLALNYFERKSLAAHQDVEKDQKSTFLDTF
jgi:hypothetical protein